MSHESWYLQDSSLCGLACFHVVQQQLQRRAHIQLIAIPAQQAHTLKDVRPLGITTRLQGLLDQQRQHPEVKMAGSYMSCTT